MVAVATWRQADKLENRAADIGAAATVRYAWGKAHVVRLNELDPIEGSG